MAAIASMSSMSGTLRSSSGWSVRRVAAMTGSAAFLLPEIDTVPLSGRGPAILRRSISAVNVSEPGSVLCSIRADGSTDRRNWDR